MIDSKETENLQEELAAQFHSPKKIITTVLICTILAEAFVMVLIIYIFPPLPPYAEIMVDVVLTGILLTLLLFQLLANPLKEQSQYQKNIQNKLSTALSDISVFDAEFAHRVLHDELTHLPNRLLFHDRLEHEVAVAERERGSFALLFIDPSSLSAINDTLGHIAGDQLIKLIGERLNKLIRKSDTLARMGGDEFAILMPTVDIETVELMAFRIHKAFEETFMIEDMPAEIYIYIGIALYPQHGTSPVDLMRRADMAMRQAKNEVTPTMVYDEKHESFTLTRREAFRELRKAVSNGDFELYYQPQMELTTYQITSAEVLVRLRGHTNISPADFIPLAEETGLIGELSAWVLKHAIIQLGIWHKQGINIELSVNISARNLLDHNLQSYIETLLEEHQVDRSMLKIELTESALMEHPKKSVHTLQQLHHAGFQLSIDDYGTGYSSLSYLQKLPVSELKIDQLFIRDILKTKNNTLIVESTLKLAASLDMSVVAEGVENSEICAQLAQLGCHKAQGYFISKPLSTIDFENWYTNLEQGVFPKGRSPTI